MSKMTRKMKDSGIEWIGEIPEEWKVIHNKYLLTKHKELIEKYNDENILSLTLNGVIIRNLNDGGKMPSSFVGYQKLYKGNLLLCLFDIDVTPRCVGLIKSDGITSPAYSQYEVNSKVADVRYYYYYFIMLDNKKVLVHMGKSLRSSISNDQFGNIDSILPPKSQQIEIADYLDKKVFEINQASQTIQQEIDALEEYRKSIITETVTKGLDKTVPMKDSGIEWIGEIPENWKVEKLKYLVETRESKILLSDVQYNYIGLENIEKNIGKYISTDSTYENQYYNFCEKGDILYSKLRPNLSKAIIAPFAACCTGEFEVIKSTKLHKKYILYYLLSNYVTDATSAAIYGTKMPRVSWNYVKNLRVVFPNQSEDQIKIVNYLDKKLTIIDQIVRQKQQQLNHLDKYKQSIIYEYVTGKKQVSEKEGVKNAQ
ncbi:restriction endonuclease subunit S [Lactobacillus johnsonii]|uniref:restriction endonuclease subunit S n=1 Tax=Lactobacillus johnsonii TaxID=33959 RepID=UPI001FB54B27|nr:restriction endonuclease subunit S [Lactobacillus johnsonii]UOC07308.1 restriction endonuclease subunit S [Lactobacillus johnsonii]